MLEIVGDHPEGAALVEQRRQVEALFIEWYGELVGLGALITGDRAAGEDIAQDVFAALYRRSEALDDPAAVVGYLRRSVVNGARDRLRRRAVEVRVHPRVVVAWRSTEDLVVAGDDAEAVGAAVATLPVRQRECVACHYQLGLSHHETAAALGISPSSVKTHLRRATRHLANVLKDRR